MSDPEVKDSDRLGDDLLARIAELKDDSPGDGWRKLLAAAGRELERLKQKHHDDIMRPKPDPFTC